MNESEETQMRAWVASWRETAAALDQIKANELRALTQEESGRGFAEMAIDSDTVWISPERSGSAGFIEQQRLFMCSHEHPARHRSRL